MRRIVHHELIAGPTGHQRSWLLVLHGIFGTGRNWGTIARRLTSARPDWGIVLVDLRLHGTSQSFAPPHTLETSAADLVALKEALGFPLRAVLGHSFGGKVALTYLKHHPIDLRQIWIIDTDPSAMVPGGSAWEMLQAVKALPAEFRSRDELILGLKRSGFDYRVAQWMATNLERINGQYRWRLDFVALEELLRDFFQTDLWSVVEHVPKDLALHFVKATQSNGLTGSSLARLETIRHATGQVFLEHIRGGHWLNVENADALIMLLTTRLAAG